MRRLIKNSQGAVTVFITLLLIPALLISGTAVDLARLNTANSIVQDSNQLAANAALTQYNALLHDMYGLFGFMANDPELAAMINRYIELSVFGEAWNDKGPDAFQLFYGSDLQPAELAPAPGKNLANADVVRRQIEDYMKYRGPIILVQEFLDALSDNKLQEDTKVVDDKLAIDSDISELFEIYKELYDAIVSADKCDQTIDGVAGGYFSHVSASLCSIQKVFNSLLECYWAWELSGDPDDSFEYDLFDTKSYYASMYAGILENIEALTIGGLRGENWTIEGWGSYYTVKGLTYNIDKSMDDADNFKSRFDRVLDAANQIDSRHDELSKKIDKLETDLERGECSEELSKALMTAGADGKSQLDLYRDILKWNNIAEMAAGFKSNGYYYLDYVFKPMLGQVKYRNSGSMTAYSLSIESLSSLSSNSAFALSSSIPALSSKAAYFAEFPYENVKYKMPAGFSRFSWQNEKNGEFFDYLKKMMSQPAVDPVRLYDGQTGEVSGDAKTKQTKVINTVLELVETAYDGLTNNPLGAGYIDDPGTPEREKMGILEITALIPKALNNNVVSVINDPLGSLGSAGGYMLLLAYCTSMFSNYSTARPESIGKARGDLEGITFPMSLTGVPISPDVNYFFQSEWEYMYNGSKNAGANLSEITKLIFLVRVICNYISVFQVSEITTIVNSIRTAFAWCPPLGLSLAELARAAFVAAETVIDVGALRSGYRVPLIKNPYNGEWVCSPSGLKEAIGKLMAEDDNAVKDEKGLSYSNYLMFFFIAKAVFEDDAGNKLAKHASNLIEWNVINYQYSVASDESLMAEALAEDGRFKMEDMTTDFRISTTVDMKMLFLSMPIAQRGIKGVIPARKTSLTVTDYRGY